MPPKKRTAGADMALPADQAVRSRYPRKNSTVNTASTINEKKATTALRGRKRNAEEPSSATPSQSPEIPAPKKPRRNADVDASRKIGVRRLLANGFESDKKPELSPVNKKKIAVSKATNVSATTSSLKIVDLAKLRSGQKKAESVAEKKVSTNKRKCVVASSASNGRTSFSTKLQKKISVSVDCSTEEDNDDSDGWEAVEEAKMSSDDDQAGPSTSTPVEITVDIAGGPKKKKEVDVAKLLVNQLKKRQKEIAIDVHKVHLLCSLAHGFYLNDVVCRNPLFLALSLSQWDMKVLRKTFGENFTADLDVEKLRALVASVKTRFFVKQDTSDDFVDLVNGVRKAISTQRCSSYLHLVLVMVLMLRSLGMDVRLIVNLRPVPVRPLKVPKSALSGKKSKSTESPYFTKLKKESGKSSPQKKKSARKRRRISSEEETDSDNSSEERPKKLTKRGSASKKKIPSRLSSQKIDSVGTEKSSKQKIKDPLADAKTKISVEKNQPSEKSPSAKKAFSSESSASFGAVGVDYWLEVYCSKVKAYVPVHCVTGVTGGYEDCEQTATHPIQYVVAFGEGRSAKDVTAKFTTNWLTVNRKLQVDTVWWRETLSFFQPPNLIRNAEEDDAIRQVLLQRPRPKSVQEFKGHPLYVLQRHLLKYEALYPPNPVPIGEIRGESVYLREVVHLLHTKENWLKEGRVIKSNEQPYKEVKKMKRAAPKRRISNDPNANLMRSITNQQLPKDEMSGLFGRWQTEDFTPPVAENGIVPRNQYGNVDMFKPSMLPVGCVHIPIKNIHKVAKKLGIDCASAMTGWDFSGGHCHPVMEGWIVCQEFQETLLDAWNTQQFEIEREEKEAKVKKALDNWRKLLKNLMLRRRLNKKYGVSNLQEKKKKRPEHVVVDVDSD